MTLANQTINCEICCARARGWARISAFDHYRCTDCGHTFVHPKPPQTELDAFYDRADYYSHAELQHDRLKAEAADRAQRLLRQAKQMGLQARLLDVGCGTGTFLLEAKRWGWNASGLDRSEKMATTARSYSQCSVTAGILETVNIVGAPFPVVTAWEVLEHAIDPRAFFSALVARVEHGGLLAVSTPLGDGLVAKVLGVRFPMLSPPDHLSIFSKRSLLTLAEGLGLSVMEWRSFSNMGSQQLASGFARFLLKSELSSLGHGARMVVDAFGVALAWAPKLIDTAGQGSEMEVVFRKGHAEEPFRSN